MKQTYSALFSPDYDLWVDENAEAIYATFSEQEKGLIQELDGLEIPLTNTNRLATPESITIKVGRKSKYDTDYVMRHSTSEFSNLDVIPIRFTAYWNRASVASQLARTGRYNLPVAIDNVCSNALEEVSRRICIALSIYLPGFADFNYAHFRPAKSYGEYNFSGLSPFGMAIKPLVNCGIDPCPSISFRVFIDWIQKSNGFWFDEPKTNIERCLNYLSHTFRTDRDPFHFHDFVWVMAAIESLYCDTTSAIAEKLRQRAAIAVPNGRELFTAKRIGRLYEFRSKFLHGSMNIPNRFTDEVDVDKDYYLFAFHNNLSLASALLVKTLQVAAEKNIRSMEFNETLG